MRKIKSFNLEVNDQKTAAKKFVQEFLGNSLLGQIECLRLKEPIVQKISLHVEFTEED